jgi:hypothetical protein
VTCSSSSVSRRLSPRHRQKNRACSSHRRVCPWPLARKRHRAQSAASIAADHPYFKYSQRWGDDVMNWVIAPTLHRPDQPPRSSRSQARAASTDCAVGPRPPITRLCNLVAARQSRRLVALSGIISRVSPRKWHGFGLLPRLAFLALPEVEAPLPPGPRISP